MAGGGVLAIAGIVAALAGRSAPAVIALLVAAVLILACLLVRAGVGVTDRHRYALTVAPDELAVTWRDQVTRLPWRDLEYGVVVENGPTMRVLEVRPNPGVRYVLPRNARPRPSRQRPQNLEVFILSFLGDQQGECIGVVAGHLDIR
jgi:hypothetical protein